MVEPRRTENESSLEGSQQVLAPILVDGGLLDALETEDGRVDKNYKESMEGCCNDDDNDENLLKSSLMLVNSGSDGNCQKTTHRDKTVKLTVEVPGMEPDTDAQRCSKRKRIVDLDEESGGSPERKRLRMDPGANQETHGEARGPRRLTQMFFTNLLKKTNQYPEDSTPSKQVRKRQSRCPEDYKGEREAMKVFLGRGKPLGVQDVQEPKDDQEA